MDAINLGAAPAAGHTLRWGGHDYVVTKGLNLTLRGTPYAEIHWRHDCADCGKPVDFRTGLKKRYLPMRCKPCNGPDDLDRIERSLYAKRAWQDRMNAAKAQQRGVLAMIRTEGFHLVNGQLRFRGIFSDGLKLELAWDEADGVTKATASDSEDTLAHLEAGDKWAPKLAVELQRLEMFT